METKFQTSFIPKASNANGPYKYRKPFGIFFAIAMLLVSISVLAAVGAYAYEYILKNRVVEKQKELAKAEASIPSADIERLTRIADKMESADQLLNSHIALTPLFSLLQEATLKRLRFNDLTYTYLSPSRIAITMKGEARDFGVVARQSDAFQEVTGQNFKSPIFTNLGTSDNGNVTFNFLTSVDPALVLYKNTLNNQQ
jgi:hypothetical protein